MSLRKQIISVIESRDDFFTLLEKNPGLIIIKLGAEWCGPCKKIEHIVHAFFASSPPDVLCADLNVDESSDLYIFLKQRKMVNGIPVILLYKKGNHHYAPDDSVTGIDPNALDAFFKRSGHHLAALNNAQRKL